MGKSYMFTMEDAPRAQNLPDDYISYMKRFVEKKDGDDLNAHFAQ